MATRGFEAMSHTLKVFVSQNAELAKQQIAAAVAQEKARVLAEARARSPQPPHSVQIVDGQRDGSITRVRPDGTVIIEWSYLKEVVAGTLEMLVAAAPRRSGAYVDSVRVFLGENDTPGTLDDITAETATCLIAPTVQYSRRLEIGHKKDGTPFVRQVAPKIVQRTRLLAKQRWDNIAAITDEWLILTGFNAFVPRHHPGRQRPSRRDTKLAADGAMRSPGIRIRLHR